jgi:hypothetical protein
MPLSPKLSNAAPLGFQWEDLQTRAEQARLETRAILADIKAAIAHFHQIREKILETRSASGRAVHRSKRGGAFDHRISESACEASRLLDQALTPKIGK